MQQLVQPLQMLLQQLIQQRDKRQALPAGADEELRARLRCVELLLENSVMPEGDEEEGDGWDSEQGHAGASGHEAAPAPKADEGAGLALPPHP